MFCVSTNTSEWKSSNAKQYYKTNWHNTTKPKSTMIARDLQGAVVLLLDEAVKE